MAKERTGTAARAIGAGRLLAGGDQGTGDRYEIILGRTLGRRTAALFPGLELSEIPGDGMRLRGTLPDQAALHGVLARIRDLGIPLLEVRRLPPDERPGQA